MRTMTLAAVLTLTCNLIACSGSDQNPAGPKNNEVVTAEPITPPPAPEHLTLHLWPASAPNPNAGDDGGSGQPDAGTGGGGGGGGSTGDGGSTTTDDGGTGQSDGGADDDGGGSTGDDGGSTGDGGGTGCSTDDPSPPCEAALHCCKKVCADVESRPECEQLCNAEHNVCVKRFQQGGGFRVPGVHQ